MSKQYQNEVSHIHADPQFKEQLKQQMAQHETMRIFPIRKAFAAFIACLLLLVTSIYAYQHSSHSPLAVLSIVSNDEQVLSGIGNSFSLGNDDSLFEHQTSDLLKDLDALPVFANPYAQDSLYLSSEPEQALIPILETMAASFHMQDYQIEHFDETADPSMINANVYLQNKDGKLILYSKTCASFILDEDISIDLSGNTQEEVMKKTQQFLARYEWISVQDPLIDVLLISQPENKNCWQICISENKADAAEALIQQQLHGYTLSLSADGTLDAITYQTVDTSHSLGNYPLKAKQEALDALLEGDYYPTYQSAVDDNVISDHYEIVYDQMATNAYYLPYYKFYVLMTIHDVSFYMPYYVIAVQDAYLDKGTA